MFFFRITLYLIISWEKWQQFIISACWSTLLEFSLNNDVSKSFVILLEGSLQIGMNQFHPKTKCHPGSNFIQSYYTYMMKSSLQTAEIIVFIKFANNLRLGCWYWNCTKYFTLFYLTTDSQVDPDIIFVINSEINFWKVCNTTHFPQKHIS